ncbi:hypothetical protein HGRIS_006765 [Hohenbuehelia grisea]|uniref:Uncharacterized protein n=1 Tax=Hohenbuehelia grisea TaxID=104357 RepID=A0ABR3JAI6_9AGAR
MAPLSPFQDSTVMFIIGGIYSLPLYGIAITQTAFYFRSFRRDPLHMKVAVALMLVVESLHTVCFLAGLYIALFVIRFGYLTLKINDAFLIADFPIYLLTSMVQIAYARRLWYLSGKNRVLITLVIFPSVISFGA